MEFKVLAVGDVVGAPGMERIRRHLRRLKRDTGADFVVVNGENASVVGITPDQAEDILDAGADVITLGNHSFSKREIKWGDVAVIDLIGRCNMDYGPDNPFLMIDRILKQVEAKFILVELHAEATSEKLAMGYMLDGRVSAVWGTHTHVPTADNRVLPGGTGYVTDLGMTGPRESVLGIRPELSIARFRGDLPQRYRWAEGATKMEGVLFTLDSATGKCLRAERVDQWD